MKIPNDAHAIIIGAMKSGTSSFYNYLVQHPQICAARTKEPEFFSENQNHKLQCNRYADLWAFEEGKHKIALEASTGYTKYPIEPNVPANIFAYDLRPKMIYCVRDPLERIQSQYEFAKRFTTWGGHDVLSEHLVELSKYHLQLERFRRYFPKEDILIIDFDEIASDPQEAASRAFDFLGVPRIAIDSSIVYNQTGVSDHEGKPIAPDAHASKHVLTKQQRKYLMAELADDMHAFEREYQFNVSKWSF